VDWLYIWGGIVVLLWGAWLFTDFCVTAACDWMLDRVMHD
jgi:hypothetical protein